MAQHDKSWLKTRNNAALLALLCCAFAALNAFGVADGARRATNANLTACQHLRRAETRRAKALQTLLPPPPGSRSAGSDDGRTAVHVRVPRCNKRGEFERIQCANERAGSDCWCVDEYGGEVPGTREASKSNVQCTEPADCPASACRMFCPAGFARDSATGCSVCRCRDPCASVQCPNGQSCQLQEVRCRSEPCPPVPTCRKARSLANYCPAGQPLAIEGSARPFLCGLDAGKPQCPPLYQCLVEGGNDYGVCCPSALKFQKPGVCPPAEVSEYTASTGYMCGMPCGHDLECANAEKCCFTKGCQFNCRAPHNVTSCQQARALADVLAINEREGRGYAPDCNGPGGMFNPKQCSRNGLVCWCVDPRSGHKLAGTMGAAAAVNCEGWENMVGRALGRSFGADKCDTNICAAVCEYGFKNDHNGCATCECAEPCEGFKCAMGSHCEVATDPLCESGSALCASWPICKPDLVYSNPCDVGTPLADNNTGEVMYCHEERKSRAFEPQLFFDAEPEPKEARSMSNRISCPAHYKCTKLHRDSESVCCPLPETPAPVGSDNVAVTDGDGEQGPRQQTMCEYLRDFSQRMEGTEHGMQLAMPAPRCTAEGNYRERQCTMRTVRVTRAEQRKILEENTIRRMRMLLSSVAVATPELQRARRNRRDVLLEEPLKLYRVDDDALKVQLAAPVLGRSAKVIAMGADRERQQGLGQLFETDFKKVAPAPKRPLNDDELVELEVEECWCVDSFGTEIPRTRGFNVSDESCVQLRDQIECLDLTCRMGCEYGFVLDSDSRCPACQCRDPCDGVSCGDGKECRIVDVSCEEEYCPPVPACLPRKAGQCPFLVPPGPENLDTNTCAYECRTDSHCDGTKRCCSNGCGTQCVEPQMRTACQHLQAIQMHQSSELGIPAKKMHVAQCDAMTGSWDKVQCALGQCWCVDERGQEVSGTRTKRTDGTDEQQLSLNCTANAVHQCGAVEATQCTNSCEAGYKTDANGCRTCECRNFCDEISCAADEECQLISVECVDTPCPRMPICVPRRESVCAEGSPLKQSGGELDVSCGPHNDNEEACPTTHTCQLNPVTHRGVCCSKTRDVCFESMDATCLASSGSEHNATRYRFSPKANRCTVVTIDLDEGLCQTKNLFTNELACNSVCPVLTQCERLKLKNSLAAQRTGHTSVWFQPRCDPVTGHWGPVQCLGKQPAESSLSNFKAQNEGMSRAFSTTPVESEAVIVDSAAAAEPPSPYGVCWCADKKGAPLKGSLTRDAEPMCNSRQGRRRKMFEPSDPLMEELIRQITLLNDVDSVLEQDEQQEVQFKLDELKARTTDDGNNEYGENANRRSDGTVPLPSAASASASVTERVLELANSLLDSQLSIEPKAAMQVKTTRCRALASSASFPVTCDNEGAFVPTQCNEKLCWCVDAAGNQLDSTEMFSHGSKQCQHTPINSVAVELHMQNTTTHSIRNVYDHIRTELQQMLGHGAVENLRVQENFDGTAVVRFELHNDEKIDLAFAIESAIATDDFRLASGHFRPDITRSHFLHRSSSAAPPLAQAISSPESAIQLVLFIMATSSAFLVSVFVVYVMLKRGRQNKGLNNGHFGYAHSGDKMVDFSAPIFVLSTSANKEAEASISSHNANVIGNSSIASIGKISNSSGSNSIS